MLSMDIFNNDCTEESLSSLYAVGAVWLCCPAGTAGSGGTGMYPQMRGPAARFLSPTQPDQLLPPSFASFPLAARTPPAPCFHRAGNVILWSCLLGKAGEKGHCWQIPSQAVRQQDQNIELLLAANGQLRQNWSTLWHPGFLTRFHSLGAPVARGMIKISSSVHTSQICLSVSSLQVSTVYMNVRAYRITLASRSWH